MASAALVVKDDGSFEATPELMNVLHMQPGTRLELVQREGDEVRFRVPAGAEELQGWRSLRGMLAGSPVDLNEERRKERERELASDNGRRE
jgi:hypothetical protein